MTTPITDAGLAELERLLEKATLGPMKAGDEPKVVYGSDMFPLGLMISEVDAALVIAAVNALPSLVHRLRTAEARVADLETVIAAREQQLTDEIACSRSLAERLLECGARAEKAEAEVARVKVTARRVPGLERVGDEYSELVRWCDKTGVDLTDFRKWLDEQDAKAASRAAPSQRGQSSAQPAAEQWQPIDTAPRDGTAILVGRHDDAWGFVRGWATYEKIRGIEGWISRGFYDPPSNLGLAYPTHWMPLPIPPADPAQGRQGEEAA